MNDARRLPLLSNSSLNTFRRCAREYFFKYVLLRKGRSKAAALRFGTLFHIMLNAWWRHIGDSLAKLFAALEALDAQEGDHDLFDTAKARALIIGYTTRWGNEGHETVAVEKHFRLPIEMSRHIENVAGHVIGTTAPHASFDLGGAIDAIALRNGRVHNVEHKTTSADISAGSNYWRHVVTMDPQVSTYEDASRRLGYDVIDTLYDVIRKPTLVPLLATPPDRIKYTKPTKAEPVARLYKGHRETDETPAEYEDRLLADIEENPEFYFQRMSIVRLEHDNVQHAEDVLGTAAAIEFAQFRKNWPRSPNACERFGRLCEYHDACSGITTIDDDSRFVTKTHQHEELQQ